MTDKPMTGQPQKSATYEDRLVKSLPPVSVADSICAAIDMLMAKKGLIGKERFAHLLDGHADLATAQTRLVTIGDDKLRVFHKVDAAYLSLYSSRDQLSKAKRQSYVDFAAAYDVTDGAEPKVPRGLAAMLERAYANKGAMADK
ncbi:MAG: hypothetical protein NT019_00885 [Candidatus Adlerbacteria bacterium]|nr:hypothetical protein [Candidatus Adlerbacteria bacterium]